MFKKFFRGLLNVLFISTTIVLITATVATIVLKPEHFKFWIQKSGVYTTLPNTIINQSVSEQTTTTNNVSLSDPIVSAAASSAITSDFVQKSSEQIIDSVFVWLNGETPTPAFSIDLLPIKQTFADKIVIGVKERYSKLPACKPGSLPKSTDPLTIECRPAYGVDIEQATEQLRTEILNNKDFLPDNTISSSSLTGQQGENTIFSSNIGPTVYQTLQLSPFVLGALLFVYAIGIILLSKTKRSGFSRVGALLILSGVLAMVSVWLASLGYGQYQEKLITSTSGPFKDVASPIIDALRYDTVKYTAVVAGAVSAIGVVVLLLTTLTKKRTKKIPKNEPRTPKSKPAEIPTEAKPLGVKPEPVTQPKQNIIKPKQQGSPTIITPTTAPEVKPAVSKKLIQ